MATAVGPHPYMYRACGSVLISVTSPFLFVVEGGLTVTVSSSFVRFSV